MITVLVFLPLLMAAIAGLGGRVIGHNAAKALTTGGLFVSAALAWVTFVGFWLNGAEATTVPVLDWIESGRLSVAWALKVDTLTAVMLVVVTSVSALVHLYSWGYMAEDPSQSRFFAYLSLFTFAMLMLVTADNLVQMFFGWEGVGLASYLLIGFWYTKPSANAAAIKAFVVNRVGDFGFSLGIFATFMVFGTVSIDAILAAVPQHSGQTFSFLGGQVDVMTCLCLLLFVGACGKSAQLGLHTWLPDAMEGPTPVSALIHAATMVTAGVFMVCRLSPMFEASPTAQAVVCVLGACTALFAATVGMVQNDIKRVIAYSTCSQLGYMFFAAGSGAYGAAMFHLFTHAFFKALLFLGAGSVIHAMHHEQDMRFYGGLRRHIPITFWMMTIGTLALTGFFFTAGYYSKDAILEAAAASHTVHGAFAFAIGAVVAALTSFYSWRLVFLTFFGKPRWAGSEHIQHAAHDDHGHRHDNAHEHAGGHAQHDDGTAGYHPHESPISMLIPLFVLGGGALFAGLIWHENFVGAEEGASFWRGSLAFNEHLMHAMHEVPAWVRWTPSIAFFVGLLSAYYYYIRHPDLPAWWSRELNGLYQFLLRKWYFDELYNAIFVKPALWFGRMFWTRGDQQTIDRFGPNGAADVVVAGAGLARRFQSGYVYSYALVMLVGLAAAAAWMMR
ncbi:NADH-quinone oxidoreductase subunit L [Sandarakinorhabdus cyanobacteriorum]|uniref:NADH-quinone oxidoreductase subunit L n=1 Tax=Sandarakinorhabdus cyanobacteriorum TaxID=1981098 RepID=A0A255YJF5_9SPHN|nr:NADH-quinone oxidoreductase subunit L [Sandarakinorhabdus cyanobacteriorum]OYQ28705.1 NADH-quinone oxidoreductase subunit L [Sandarakinorhabdus cyanobacteriorum]